MIMFQVLILPAKRFAAPFDLVVYSWYMYLLRVQYVIMKIHHSKISVAK